MFLVPVQVVGRKSLRGEGYGRSLVSWQLPVETEGLLASGLNLTEVELKWLLWLSSSTLDLLGWLAYGVGFFSFKKNPMFLVFPHEF